MNQVVSAVKKNLDLSQNRPIKEAIYEAQDDPFGRNTQR